MDNTHAAALVAVLFSFAFVAVVYVATALGLSRIFGKVGEPAWKGWVPVVNVMTVLQLGGYSPLWVIAFFIPVANIVGAVYFYLAIHAINRRFGKDIVFTIVAIVVLPVWACLLGFGTATTSSASPRPASSRSTPAVVPGAAVSTPSDVPLSAATPAAPFVAIVPPPPAAFVTGPGDSGAAQPVRASVPQGGIISPPSFISPPPGLAPSVATPAPAPAPVVPSVPDAMSSPETTPIATPVAPADPETPEASLAPSPSASTAWVLTTAEGQRVSITGTVALLGRNPAADAAYPNAQLVSVDDPAKTVSKTHARIELVDDSWSLTDLGSTNGVLLVAGDGRRTDLIAGTTVTLTEHFQLGDLPIRLSAE